VDNDPSYIQVPEQSPQLLFNTNRGSAIIKHFLKDENAEKYLDQKNVNAFFEIPYILLGFLDQCRRMKLEYLRDCMKILLPTVNNHFSPSKRDRDSWSKIGKSLLM
jgi:hypothetical protein